MKKLMIAAVFAGVATSAAADEAKPKMSAEEFEQQVIVSTHDTTGSMYLRKQKLLACFF